MDKMDTYMALKSRVDAAWQKDIKRRDLQGTADLIDELGLKTLDGVAIRCGMRVVDYDMRWTTITGIQSVDYHDDGNHAVWFKTANGGMFDASRLWASMP